MAEPEKLEALYFPFSRSIDPSSTKQMLLVFDTIHFLDPVDDEEWRAALMDQMVDRRFAAYRSVADAIPTLVQEGAVVRRDPALLTSIKAANVAASAVGDLLDVGWVRVASAPARFGMPHLCAGAQSVAMWESFDEKLPPAFLEALNEVPELRRHVILHGNAAETWMLSYEAGSAIALSSHLAAASELGLATVTDSRLHHHLLQSKGGTT